jgi:hypothetical protein
MILWRKNVKQNQNLVLCKNHLFENSVCQQDFDGLSDFLKVSSIAIWDTFKLFSLKPISFHPWASFFQLDIRKFVKKLDDFHSHRLILMLTEFYSDFLDFSCFFLICWCSIGDLQYLSKKNGVHSLLSNMKRKDVMFCRCGNKLDY